MTSDNALPLAASRPQPDQAPAAAGDTASAVTRLVRFYEHLAPADVARIGELYAPDAYFKDPFNEVRGVPAIARIFAHMFETLDQPRFVITAQVVQGAQCFLAWEFRFAFRRFSPGMVQTVRGASHVVFDAQHRVAHHRDYWDAAEELYEKLPALGTLMRWLRRRVNA